MKRTLRKTQRSPPGLADGARQPERSRKKPPHKSRRPQEPKCGLYTMRRIETIEEAKALSRNRKCLVLPGELVPVRVGTRMVTGEEAVRELMADMKALWLTDANDLRGLLTSVADEVLRRARSCPMTPTTEADAKVIIGTMKLICENLGEGDYDMVARLCFGLGAKVAEFRMELRKPLATSGLKHSLHGDQAAEDRFGPPHARNAKTAAIQEAVRATHEARPELKMEGEGGIYAEVPAQFKLDSWHAVKQRLYRMRHGQK